MIRRALRRIRLLAPKEDVRADFLRLLPMGGRCAEIGVWKGDFSDLILRVNQPAALHLVDPWQFMSHLPESWQGGLVARGQSDMDAIAAGVVDRFAANPVVRIHRMTSREFFSSAAEESFDWIYIDGDHSEHAVLEDLRLAWPLVRPGGVLSGDDLFLKRGEANATPVASAVIKFAVDVEVSPAAVGSQYMFIKPSSGDPD